MKDVIRIQVILRDIRIAPRKVRLVAGIIRGMDALAAVDQLSFLRKKSAEAIKKLLLSAVANAKNVYKIEKENLKIDQVLVNKGSTLKRWQPKAMGRATPIHKKCSHVTIVLVEKKRKKQNTVTPSKAKKIIKK